MFYSDWFWFLYRDLTEITKLIASKNECNSGFYGLAQECQITFSLKYVYTSVLIKLSTQKTYPILWHRACVLHVYRNHYKVAGPRMAEHRWRTYWIHHWTCRNNRKFSDIEVTAVKGNRILILYHWYKVFFPSNLDKPWIKVFLDRESIMQYKYKKRSYKNFFNKIEN